MSKKPVYINLLKIQLPLSALLSISHRVSGIMIFFMVLPVFAYILNILLDSPASFISYMDAYNSSIFLRTFVLFNILIFEYHVIAGIRHMLMDFHIISETLSASNTSAKIALIVFIINALLTILVLTWNWVNQFGTCKDILQFISFYFLDIWV